MDVIGGDRVIEHTQPEAPPRFVEPDAPEAPITRKLQQKPPVVAPMGQVPNLPRHVDPMCARHAHSPFEPPPGARNRLRTPAKRTEAVRRFTDAVDVKDWEDRSSVIEVYA